MTSGGGSNSRRARQLRPSNRAWALVDTTTIDECNKAYYVDHALLVTHIAMLKKEIERYQVTAQSQAWVGNFLAANNVWSILEKSDNVDDGNNNNNNNNDHDDDDDDDDAANAAGSGTTAN